MMNKITHTQDPARLMIVDDHQMVREAMTLMLGLETDFLIVGSVGSITEAQYILRQEKIDLLILDLLLGDIRSHEFVAALRSIQPNLIILLVTGSQLPVLLEESLSLGVNGIMAKNADSDALCTAIRKLLAGDTYICTEIANLLNQPSPLLQLTARERDVLCLIAQGADAPMIATALAISHATVRKHRENLMRKLNLHNTAELMRFAHHQGLVNH